jgi:hypothetical protein
VAHAFLQRSDGGNADAGESEPAGREECELDEDDLKELSDWADKRQELIEDRENWQRETDKVHVEQCEQTLELVKNREKEL